jgi:ssDNA-binding Zn-finger/Zn-ribbon topoisomerase 1
MKVQVQSEERNVSIVSQCPKCDTLGHVRHHRGFFIIVNCPSCNFNWKTLSEQCPNCKKPNGYLMTGTCKGCYSESRSDKY